MTRAVKDVAASTLAKLRTVARTSAADFNVVLQRYALERWLYRLSVMELRKRNFVLKGGYLLRWWYGEGARHTRDIDLLGPPGWSEVALADAVAEVSALEVPFDGVVFDASSVTSETLDVGDGYRPLRVTVRGTLGKVRLTVRVDIGRGDEVYPPPEAVTLPVLIAEHPPPRIDGYPREAVVAEKLHAIVTRGLANTRVRDYGDLWVLARDPRGFELTVLWRSIATTFGRRQTARPSGLPAGLTAAFAVVPGRQAQWAKERRQYPGAAPPERLVRVVTEVAEFAARPLEAASGPPLSARWDGRGWRDD